MWENQDGILLSGVPVQRKTAKTRHIENEGEMARVEWADEQGHIDVMHTPQDAFLRVHEWMHANHSNPARMQDVYEGIHDSVWQVVEDCKIHRQHWPWPKGCTPKPIKDSALAFLRKEKSEVDKVLAKDPSKVGSWPDFATRLRQSAIRIGMGENANTVFNRAGFADKHQKQFAHRILRRVFWDEERQAALEIEEAFFEPLSSLDLPGNSRSGVKRPGRDSTCSGQPKMEIIALPLTEIIPEAKRGYRRAASGSRLHRPSIRKPVLPQKLFIRRTPRVAAGAILVDASGSMGDFSEITKWCEKAPFGTIAYYAGGGKDGVLYIYAKDGKRAAQIVDPGLGGNTVDGPALDWLMKQPKPRLFITDRGFCGAPDSEAQVMRLANLERRGEVVVKDYAHGDDE